jgi:hypothetical protein
MKTTKNKSPEENRLALIRKIALKRKHSREYLFNKYSKKSDFSEVDILHGVINPTEKDIQEETEYLKKYSAEYYLNLSEI